FCRGSVPTCCKSSVTEKCHSLNTRGLKKLVAAPNNIIVTNERQSDMKDKYTETDNIGTSDIIYFLFIYLFPLNLSIQLTLALGLSLIRGSLICSSIPIKRGNVGQFHANTCPKHISTREILVNARSFYPPFVPSRLGSKTVSKSKGTLTPRILRYNLAGPEGI
ncbi:hypothetical protein L9F63_004230, partial [Diploptera punctata]